MACGAFKRVATGFSSIETWNEASDRGEQHTKHKLLLITSAFSKNLRVYRKIAGKDVLMNVCGKLSLSCPFGTNSTKVCLFQTKKATFFKLALKPCSSGDSGIVFYLGCARLLESLRHLRVVCFKLFLDSGMTGFLLWTLQRSLLVAWLLCRGSSFGHFWTSGTPECSLLSVKTL